MPQHKTITYCTLPIFAVFAFLFSYKLQAAGAGSALLISISLTVFVFLAFFALCRGIGRPNMKIYLPVLIATYLMLWLRLLCFDHQTLDYQDFLRPWVEYYRANGGLAALDQSVGNYNIPYLLFLALFSYFPVSELYLIKLLSVIFDLLLALSVAKLVLRCSGSVNRGLISFAVTMMLPTVLLNGSYWGQCDSVYGALAILSVYLILTDRPWLSMVSLALAFSFKLQAIFIFPVFLVFLYTGRLKLKHLPVFPAAYIVAVSPAILAGRPILDTLLIYVNQGGTVGSGLNYNSPSIYSLISNPANPELAGRLGIIAAFLFCLLMFALLFLVRKSLDESTLLLVSFIFVLTVPLLLPHMHDRYFFLADVLSLAVAFVFTKAIPFPFLCSFASLLGYHAYLKQRYLLLMDQGFCALALVLLYALVLLVKRIWPQLKQSTVQAAKEITAEHINDAEGKDEYI